MRLLGMIEQGKGFPEFRNAVGLLAALIGLRRTSHIDPALAIAN